jgi:lipopolysaccharide export LptBFGC system permease protein LptF
MKLLIILLKRKQKMDKIFTFLGTAFIFVVIIFGIAVLLALPTMWLWNWLMPQIFQLKEITFWQALGLNLLCGILFKGSNSSSKK